MKKTNFLLTSSMLLLAFLTPTISSAEGRQYVGDWYVRWSDAGKHGSYASTYKTDNLSDLPGKKDVSISISQNIVNEVGLRANFLKDKPHNGCKDSEKSSDAVVEINGQSVKMTLTIYEAIDCEVSYIWGPVSIPGKKYLRSAFNSGVVIFTHGSFDHIFDTRGHPPAYNLMRKMAEKEIEKAKNAL